MNFISIFKTPYRENGSMEAKMKKPKEKIPTVKDVITESEKSPKETEIIGKETLPNLMKSAEKRINSSSKLNETMFLKVDDKTSKPIEDMQKKLDEMKSAALKISFVSVKDIPENETLPIRVGQTYIALDKLDMQMVFEWVTSKLVDIAKEKAKKDRSDQVRIVIKDLGDIIFGRNSLVGTVTNSDIFLPIVANDHSAHCSEDDCKSCPYNKICSPGR
jgi:hypothetical protein